MIFLYFFQGNAGSDGPPGKDGVLGQRVQRRSHSALKSVNQYDQFPVVVSQPSNIGVFVVLSLGGERRLRS